MRAAYFARSSHCSLTPPTATSSSRPYTALRARGGSRGCNFDRGANVLGTEGRLTGQSRIDFGRRWLPCPLVAHSEIRQFCGETDERACIRLKMALAAGLKPPILCVGELSRRACEARKTESCVERQFRCGVTALTSAEVLRIILRTNRFGNFARVAQRTPIWLAEDASVPIQQAAQCLRLNGAARLRFSRGT